MACWFSYHWSRRSRPHDDGSPDAGAGERDARGDGEPPPEANGRDAEPGVGWWQDEGAKIGLGAFYALCIGQCFLVTGQYFGRQPVDLSALPASLGEVYRFVIGVPRGESPFPLYLHNDQIAVVAQLAAFTAWISMNFLYNTQVYFEYGPARARYRNFAYINITLGLFFFLGSTIGTEDRRQQIFLIGVILLSDLIFPLRRAFEKKQSRRFVQRTIASLAFAWGTLLFAPDAWVNGLALPIVFLGLILIQLYIAGKEAADRRSSLQAAALSA